MYLSGHVRDGWPAMLTPAIGQQPPAGQPWAADTGCYANPAEYSDERYLAWLASMPLERCLFATAPDSFGNGQATLELALPMLPRIRAAGAPAALVVQPGTRLEQVPWAQLDYLFVGGPNPWQHSEACAALVLEARRREVPVHVGRVNGWRRMLWAAALGASTVDGTFLRYGPDHNERRLRAWLARLEQQPPLTWAPA